MDDNSENYTLAHNIIVFLDVLLSVLIIAGSYFIINTALGAAAIAFGFIMLTTTVILKIIQKW